MPNALGLDSGLDLGTPSVSVPQGNPTTSSNGPSFWDTLGNVVKLGTNVYGTVAGADNAQNAASNTVKLQQAQLTANANANAAKSKTLIWVIGGVVAVALIVGVIAMFRRGK